MSYTIQGKVHKITEREQKSAKLTVRDIVIESVDGAYTNYTPLQLINDRCDIIEKQHIAVGDEIIAHFDVRGREWNGKYFVNLNCWKIEGEVAQQPGPVKTEPAPQTEAAPAGGLPPSDDLPF